ncbi:hypothetical protein [Limnovirga soli]|uniref:Sulfotransferase family protein n=1 Tax=Limnovirga soli TaxID=2656915 RepID=A0A8J8JS57_9BACT|nr:hypothetical protein [Limnovirga soli]NNV56582.1 hypothetical protein [Limnovirga soli]
MDNKVLIILGMHRSGTSLIAQWLHKCGMQLGDRLHGADIGNVEGHFEDIDFLQLHRQMLTDQKMSSVGLVYNEIDSIDAYFIKKIRALIDFKNSLHTQWGWKEPRTCLFLSYYREFLSNANYLVVIRDYHSVVTSLVERDFKSYEKRIYARSSYISNAGRFIYTRYWKFIKRNYSHKKFYSRYTAHFLKVWITYNSALLKHLELSEPGKYVLIEHKALQNKSKELFEVLESKWQFSLHYEALGSIFKTDLITKKKDISLFVKDQALLKTADVLYKTLKQFSI